MKDVKEFIQDALKQYKVNDPNITNAIYDYCTNKKYRVDGDMKASTDYDKFEKENADIIKKIAKIKGFATGMNYDQRDAMLTDHGTEVFPMILSPKFAEKLQAKLAKNVNKESEAIGYNLHPLDQYKDLRFANHATLIAQTMLPFAQMEYERIFKKCFPGDYSIKFDGENISVIDDKGQKRFDIINQLRVGNSQNTEPIKYTKLFETSAFKKLYNEAVKDNLKTEKMELFSFNGETKEIEINNGIKSIYEPIKPVDNNPVNNNPVNNNPGTFLKQSTALSLEDRIKNAAKQLINREVIIGMFDTKNEDQKALNKVNILKNRAQTASWVREK